ncbi:hypothetical protein BJ912DRAFT_1045869 [Pholiota molesta]|nr:hypothetical protein BJ912DRAFT_1045869 [Pholiota molesta]
MVSFDWRARHVGPTTIVATRAETGKVIQKEHQTVVEMITSTFEDAYPRSEIIRQRVSGVVAVHQLFSVLAPALEDGCTRARHSPRRSYRLDLQETPATACACAAICARTPDYDAGSERRREGAYVFRNGVLCSKLVPTLDTPGTMDEETQFLLASTLRLVRDLRFATDAVMARRRWCGSIHIPLRPKQPVSRRPYNTYKVRGSRDD